MDMKIGKKERDLLIGLLGVLLAIVSWFYIASPTIEKTDALRSENAILKAKADEYEIANMQLSDHQAAIVLNQAEIEDITTHYPGEIKTEDQIMFWANIDNAYPEQLAFADLAIEDRDVIALSVDSADDIGEDVQVNYDESGNASIKDSDIENITAKYVLYGAPMGMNFACTYSGLKNMFNYITSQYDKNLILGTEVYYDDSTGLLQGNIAMELCYIQGLDKEYTPTFIPAVPTGQMDVFHTGSIGSLAEAKAAAEAQDGSVTRTTEGKVPGAAAEDTGVAGSEYILNTSTMKFHNPSCSEVSLIELNNKQSVIESRNQLMNEGYTPCDKCNP